MKQILLMLGLTGLFLTSCGQKKQEVSAELSRSGKSLLWKVEKKGHKTSFLFGTIHMICPDDMVWTKAMDQSLGKCDKVCFEMDMDDPEVLMKTALGFVDASGRKLEDYFDKDAYQRISRIATDSLGMNLELFSKMKPAILLSLFAKSYFDCAAPVSYEEHIMGLAAKEKKEILGLETPQEQVDLLNNIPADTIVAMVYDNIDNISGNKAEQNRMVQAYKAQDLPALYEQIRNSKEMGGDIKIFLDDRNERWISRMSDKMNGQSVFFAVGAGHLWGPNGVIALLRKAGYTVTPQKDAL